MKCGLFLLLWCISSVAYAQQIFPMQLGPFFSVKAGVNAASIPEGFKTGVAFNGMPDIGASFYLPLSKQSNIGVLADLGYVTYAYKMRFAADEEGKSAWTVKTSYIALAPQVYLSGFVIGFNFGIPVSYSEVYPTETISRSTSPVAMLIEGRLGGCIPLHADESGRLNLLIHGGYMLTGVAKDNSSSENPHVASLGLGFSYLFTISR